MNETDSIKFKNEWSKKDISYYVKKYAGSTQQKILHIVFGLLIIEFILHIDFTKPSSIIAGTLLIVLTLLFVYSATFIAKTLLIKNKIVANSITITDNEIYLDNKKIDSIFSIVISNQFLFIKKNRGKPEIIRIPDELSEEIKKFLQSYFPNVIQRNKEFNLAIYYLTNTFHRF